MTLIDPRMTAPAMDAITHGWANGRASKSIQFIAFEDMLDKSLADLRAAFALGPVSAADFATPAVDTPLRLLMPEAA
jgi:ubiquinone biosynthesis protein Coq4